MPKCVASTETTLEGWGYLLLCSWNISKSNLHLLLVTCLLSKLDCRSLCKTNKLHETGPRLWVTSLYWLAVLCSFIRWINFYMVQGYLSVLTSLSIQHVCWSTFIEYQHNLGSNLFMISLTLLQCTLMTFLDWHVRLVSLEIWFIHHQTSRRRFLMQGHYNLWLDY